MADPFRHDPSLRTFARRRALMASTSLIAAFAASAASAQQLPTHGSVASGSAVIGGSGSAMTINQTSSRAVINWNSFSIGAGASVTFVQPDAASAVLNRVTGTTSTSIAGALNANGQVFVINPNGVLITKSGVVNAGGGFVASTLSLSDRDFNRGALDFKGAGASAAVSNAGTITTGTGGFVGLLGGTVSNSGVINAPLGKVALGSGERATLDLDGDGFLQIALPTQATDAEGKALIDVSGTVKAGAVAIKAATAANAVRNAINLSGYVSARSARQVGGSIVLGGGEGGDVKVSGKLDASGAKRGGAISVTGHDVALNQAKLRARSSAGAGGSVAVTGKGAVSLAQSRVDVSGAAGGGDIAIGGGARGKGPLAHSNSTTIEASTLSADALTSGNGGAIAIWSDGVTTVSGLLSARGGAVSGDGGLVETSGHEAKVNGAQVDTTAAHGATGLWLIDPTDFVIAASGGDETGAQLSANLATTDVTIASSAGTTGTAGNIVVNDAVSWSAATTLTFSAFNDVLVNANITVAGAGQVAFNTGVGNTVPGAVLYSLDQTGPFASLTFTGAGGPQPLTINGTAYTLLRSQTDLAQITAAPAGHYALANDISLTTPLTTSLAATFTGGLDGLGHNLSNLTINPGAATTDVGLFGAVGAGGVVSNLFLANATVNGGGASNVGILAGENSGEIHNNGSSGTLNGTGSNLGGLVGLNAGLVLVGYSAATVNGASATSNNVGGLVGSNTGGVVSSFATGDATGDDNVGGLVGSNSGYVNGGASGNIVGNGAVGGVVGLNNAGDGDDFVFGGVDYGQNGTVAGAFFFGFAFGTAVAGGVVGQNSGTVDHSFSSGPVQGNSQVGGLVGENDGAITDSYATGAVTGLATGTEPPPQDIGGLVGLLFGSIDGSFAMGAVTGGATGINVGGLVGRVGATEGTSTISNTYATGAVSGASGLGGLIGTVDGGATLGVTNSYWDTQTSGQTASAGVGGLGETTAQLQGGATMPLTGFAGGAASNAETNVYPYPTSFFPNGVRAVSGFAFKNASGGTPLVSGTAGAATVTLDTVGSIRNQATTGANGYYYVFLDPTKLASGSNAVVYTVADATTGATNAATYVENLTANNTTANILGTTLTETTGVANYSQLVAAVNAATNGDALAAGALAGVADINITATNAAFNVDQAITPTANVTLAGSALTFSSPITTAALTVNATSLAVNGAVSASTATFNTPVTLGANVSATGAILFSDAVTLGATVTVSGPSTFFASTIGGGAAGAGLTVSGGTVVLDGNVATNNGALSFGGPVTIGANLTMTSGTATTTFGSTLDSAGDSFTSAFNLTASAGGFSFGGAIGATFSFGALSFTSTAALSLPTVNAVSLFAQTTGANAGLTLNGVITASGDGTAVTLVANGPFTNNAGAGAIVLTGDPQWLIYLPSPVGSNFGGLDSGNFPIWNTTYPGTGVPATGNFYLFAFQPTVTFTSINDAKTYGQNVASAVANDFTVSGIQPGVAGAYLGGTAAGAYSGAPSVTSAGSAPTASVAGGPYAINVANGTLAAINGYALAFASPGQLSVSPEAITVTGAPNSKVYDSTTSAAAAPTVTSGTLFDAATLAETYATPNVGAGITMNPTIAFASPGAASNYAITLAPTANGTITAAPITITSTANTKTYDATTSAAAAPTVTSGTLYDAATLAETYATPNAGTGITLNPTIAFASPGAANNYTVTLAPTANGTITPASITVTGAPNTKVYDSTTSAAAKPTITSGTLYDAATLAETYATPNAGTGITMNPTIAFASPGAANNYTVTLAPTANGTITPAPITITSAANAKTYDATVSAAAAPTVTSGTLYDAATLAETYATPNAGKGLTLNPTIAFASPGAASNYTITLAPTANGVINPMPIFITAAANSKTYDATTAAAATPTVSGSTSTSPGAANPLLDAATLSETYATPNAGTGLTLNPQIAFANPAAANNYAITSIPSTAGVINPEPLVITATPFTKFFDGTTVAATSPTLTSGTLFDKATLSESFASANPSPAINLIPSIAFANAGAANNYAITLVPTGTVAPNTGVILPPFVDVPVNDSPSVFVNRPPALGIPDFSGVCATSPQLPDVSSFADPAAAIQAISAATTQYVERCRDASQGDIANALDAYADALEVVIQKLPAKLRVQLQGIPRLVHAAAQRARVAPTRAAAVRVLQATVAAVRREIALVRADDPDSARIRSAVNVGVSGVLNTAALSLARAEGI